MLFSNTSVVYQHCSRLSTVNYCFIYFLFFFENGVIL
nr:MAG TPA: hypothetical protein [Caudoviricetes sp.]